MEDFKTRKAEYLKKLRNNPKIASEIIKNLDDSESDQKTIGIVIAPANDKELALADYLFSFMSESDSLEKDIFNDEIEKIPNEENESIELFSDIINVTKNGEEFSSIALSNPEYLAKVLYQFYVSYISDTENFRDAVAQKTGFNLDNKIEATMFLIHFDKAVEIFKKQFDTKQDIMNCTSEDIEESNRLLNEFKRLHKEGKKECTINSPEAFVKKLTNLLCDVIYNLENDNGDKED